jgi:CcmD family protein
MSDLYWVIAAALVGWVGLFAYLVYVERRVRDLEDRL